MSPTYSNSICKANQKNELVDLLKNLPPIVSTKESLPAPFLERGGLLSRSELVSDGYILKFATLLISTVKSFSICRGGLIFFTKMKKLSTSYFLHSPKTKKSWS